MLDESQKDRAVELLRIIVLPPYGMDDSIENDHIFQRAITEARALLGFPEPKKRGAQPRSFYGIHKPKVK